MTNRKELANTFVEENSGCGCDDDHLHGTYLAGFSAGVEACIEALRSEEAGVDLYDSCGNDPAIMAAEWLEKKKGEL